MPLYENPPSECNYPKFYRGDTSGVTADVLQRCSFRRPRGASLVVGERFSRLFIQKDIMPASNPKQTNKYR